MSGPPPLVLLTATYPFGNKSETFLESEIEVLARRFPSILVLPSAVEAGERTLPDGVELVRMDWLAAPSGAARRLALLSAEALAVLAAPGTLGAHAGAPRAYLDILARNVLKLRSLRALMRARPGLRDAVFYDYWFENSTLALALARRQGTVRTAVSRAHGFDLYDERWASGVVPFRAFKLRALDLVAPVSEFGTRYLIERAPPEARPRIRTFRLGVPASASADLPPADPPLVLSVGSMIPTKRIALVPEVLARTERALHWVHLGDGPERARVEEAARRLPERVRWELRGHVDNAELLRFYREHRVDAMISMSTSEGLPVSMMEAVSFGVPVVAVAVHGVPEIVTDTTGVRLPPDATVEAAAEATCRALEPGRFDRKRIRAFHREQFEAGANYDRFADALIALREDQAPPS
jgi:glycosyltransferase involved in cell wall biosynthesis